MATYYAEKLKDPRWQKKRLEIMNRDNWACQYCGTTTDTLHVHHSVYINGNEPWDYPDHVFKTLCDNCHGKEHESWDGTIEILITLGLRLRLTLEEREWFVERLKKDTEFIQSFKNLLHGSSE